MPPSARWHAVAIVLLTIPAATAFCTRITPPIRPTRAESRMVAPLAPQGPNIQHAKTTASAEQAQLDVLLPDLNEVAINLGYSRKRQQRIDRRLSILQRLRAKGSTKRTSHTLLTRCLAEFFGTAFILSCGSIIGQGSLPFPFVAIGWGIIVGLAVHAFASISEAHFNPAVTLALVANGAFSLNDVPAYMLSQYAGALAASLTVVRHLTAAPTGSVLPPSSILRAEVFATAALMYVIMAISDGVESGRIAKRRAPVFIGLLITALQLSASHLGAGVNPAMSAGPHLAMAVGSSVAQHAQWRCYTLGPFIGALLGVGAFAFGAGRGGGAFRGIADFGRLLSPWYGEVWEPIERVC